MVYTEHRHEEEEILAFPGREPLHGFQGDRAMPEPAPRLPAGLTLAISREAGSRGTTIARRAGQRLGWQVYDQETLEHAAQEELIREEIVAGLTAEQTAWAEQQLEELRAAQLLSDYPGVHDLARMILRLGARGEVVLVGRGAGFLLPAASTLHARIVAPLSDRIRYMSQWLRLSHEKAADQVRLRDTQRAEFLSTIFPRRPKDQYAYDLLVNSSLLGVEACADLIAAAAQAKTRRLAENLP